MVRKGYTLDLLGQPMADINTVVEEATIVIAAYNGFNTPCSATADCRQKQCAYNIGPSTTAQPSPPTTVSFEQYFRRAHHQVALWYSALSGDAPAQYAVEYSWE